MNRLVKKGSVDQSVELYIVDSTDGTPETGVAWDTPGIDLWYRREGAAVVSITEATLASLSASHADGGFIAISNGNYRFDVPDAAYADGAGSVLIGGMITGMVVMPVAIQLVDFDPNDAASLGLSRLADWTDGGRLDLILDAAAASAATAASGSASISTTIGAAGAGLTGIPKTGYKLAADGLDTISPSTPDTVAETFPTKLMQLWARFFGRHRKDDDAGTITTYRADGTTVATTQEFTSEDGVDDVGAAT